MPYVFLSNNFLSEAKNSNEALEVVKNNHIDFNHFINHYLAN